MVKAFEIAGTVIAEQCDSNHKFYNSVKLFYKIKRTIACTLIKKKVSLNLPEAIISFSFDDIPDSAITNGARILQKYGYNGTYYISLSLKDNHDKNKLYFDHSKLKKIVDDGGELACHTADHIAFYNSNSKEVLSNLKKNQEKIHELIPGYKFESFSYPSGQQTFRSKLILRKEYHSARGVKAGMHVGSVDLYNLYGNELAGHITLPEVFALIDEAIKNKAWLIFYTHEVEENPSPYGCTPEFFEQVVSYCYKKKADVRTIKDAVDRITSKTTALKQEVKPPLVA